MVIQHMTKLLYQEDSYLKEFDATVERTEGRKIVLNKTAFNPRAGGLESDTGYIVKGERRYRVVKVYLDRETGDVIHELEGEHDLREGIV